MTANPLAVQLIKLPHLLLLKPLRYALRAMRLAMPARPNDGEANLLFP